MSALKKALVSVAMVGAMAAPALADDFGAAGCVVKDGDYIVMGVNKIKEGFGEMTLRQLKQKFGAEHQGKIHDALHLPVGRRDKDPDFKGTSKEWAVLNAGDELGLHLKVVGDKPLWTEKMGGSVPEFKGKDVVIYQCELADKAQADRVRKAMSWDVPETPFGGQYLDPRTMKDPAGKAVNIKWRYPEDRTRIIEKLYAPK